MFKISMYDERKPPSAWCDGLKSQRHGTVLPVCAFCAVWWDTLFSEVFVQLKEGGVQQGAAGLHVKKQLSLPFNVVLQRCWLNFKVFITFSFIQVQLINWQLRAHQPKRSKKCRYRWFANIFTSARAATSSRLAFTIKWIADYFDNRFQFFFWETLIDTFLTHPIS